MLDIAKLTLREIALPLKEPFESASGRVESRRILLVEIKNQHGTSGWAECVAMAGPDYSPETIDTAWIMIRDWVAPRLMGREFNKPEEVHLLLERHFRGNEMAKGAVEMAVWDLSGQIEGMSLAEVLGGKRDKVPTGIAIGLQESPKALAAKAMAACEEGYQRIKVKIQPGRDIQYIRAVFAELGPDGDVMVDANGAYTHEDFSHIGKLDEFGLLMIEQPLAWDDLRHHAELQSNIRTPICLDESIYSLARTQEMIDLKAAEVVNIKPGRVGGFANAIAIHDLCQENDIPVWCGGMLESGIGRAHNVALATLPNFVIPGDLSPSARYWEEDIVEPEWTMDGEGNVAVPRDKPGMGVTVNLERVESLTVRSETLVAEQQSGPQG